jgi:DNA primase
MNKQIPRAFIDDLLQRIDIVEIIDAYVPLKKKGANHSACCPFHQEKTPSFTVSSQKQFYYCFGCGAHGNAIKFLMDYERMEFVEAIETLAHKAGVTIPYQQQQQSSQVQQTNGVDHYQLMAEIAHYYQQQLRQHPAGKQVIEYLKHRGLTGDIAKRYALGFAPAGWDNLLKKFANNNQRRQALAATGMLIEKNQGGHYDRFRERLMFPIRDRRGRVIAFGGRVLDESTPKYLNSPETAIYHKGMELYGLYEARQAQRDINTLIVVEGYMDVIALAQHGIQHAVASLGTAITKEQIQRLSRQAQEIVFCFDGDAAGLKAAERAMQLCLAYLPDHKTAKFLFLPAGEDPDSMVRSVGQQAFLQQVADALPVTNWFLQQLDQVATDQSVDSKTAQIHYAASMLNSMPENTRKTLLLETSAQRIGTAINTLQHAIADKSQPHANQPTTHSAQTAKQPMRIATHLRRAIAMLLQYPQLIQYVPPQITHQQLPKQGAKLWSTLTTLLQQNPNCTTTAHILAHWPNPEEIQLLSKLAAWAPWEDVISEAEISVEFQHVIQQLSKLSTKQNIQQLMQKARQQTLSPAEKSELLALIQQQRDPLAVE